MMINTNHIVLPNPVSYGISTTPAHPQLRDLLVCPFEAPDSVEVACWDSIAHHDLTREKCPQYTRLDFTPSALVYGCGLVAAGGQSAELALKSADPKSRWCYRSTNSSRSGSINNSIFISPSPLSSQVPRVLVSNNDETVKVYEVRGHCPDFRGAGKRRKGQRERRGLTDDNLMTVEEGNSSEAPTDLEQEATDDCGTTCSMEELQTCQLKFPTAINHSSVSPDGRRMVSVGDTNEIFLFDVMHNGTYQLVDIFHGSEDAAFSSDWSSNSQVFAVGSQDGFVHIYDVRNLPPSSTLPSSMGSTPRKVATLQSTQSGSAGSIRKVKFSPVHIGSELLAFTEHRNKVQIVDARTFGEVQILDVNAVSDTHRSMRLSNDLISTSGIPSEGDDVELPNMLQSAQRIDSQNMNYLQRIVYYADARTREAQILRLLDSASSHTNNGRGAGILRSQPPQVSQFSEDMETSVASNRRQRLINDDDCPPDDHRVRRRSQSPSQPSSSDIGVLPPPAPAPLTTTATATTTTAPAASGMSDRSTSPRSPNTTFGLSGYAPISTLVFPSRDSSTLASHLHAGYQPNSLYFPLESTPSDLLGLAWDEWGETLYLATEAKVWEWDVDLRGRRCFGSYGVI